jgi:hypothetical protein
MFLRSSWYVAAWDRGWTKAAGADDPRGARGLPAQFGLGDPVLDKVFNVDFVNVFREDVAILEAQQAMMKLRPNAASISIKVDAAPMAARRLLGSMIAGKQPPCDVNVPG